MEEKAGVNTVKKQHVQSRMSLKDIACIVIACSVEGNLWLQIFLPVRSRDILLRSLDILLRLALLRRIKAPTGPALTSSKSQTHC